MALLDISPIIPLPIGQATWHSFCVRERRNEEGHTFDEHLVLVYTGSPRIIQQYDQTFAGVKSVPVRIHSECLFGDVFDSTRCDCAIQLAYAISTINTTGCGVIVYLRQEGRGIGLYDKIRSINVEAADSFTRNELLGLPKDSREYFLAAQILQLLGVHHAKLMSGNPKKIAALRAVGIKTTPIRSLFLADISGEAREDIDNKIVRGYVY